MFHNTKFKQIPLPLSCTTHLSTFCISKFWYILSFVLKQMYCQIYKKAQLHFDLIDVNVNIKYIFWKTQSIF